MATAAGIPDHTAPTARSSSNLENCWDSCAWEQTENHTESPGSESGEFSADRSMEWVFKSSPWVDWDSMMVFPGRGREAERRLQTSHCSFPLSTLEASAAAEEHGVKQIADQTLTQGNSSTESRGMKGENNGETESSNSRGGLDHKLPSEAESGQDQRSLASVELASCSLSSGYNHGVLWQNQKKDPGETQLKSTVKDHAQGFCLGFGEQMETDRRRGRDEEVQSKEVKAEVRNADALIGLKLGKRTYFEDSSGYAMGKVASAPPSAPPFPVKKQRLQSQASQIPRCQVQGCNLDLSTVKDYHRRHKVCEAHSKSLRVVVAGLEQRFCQQCSRFHILSEFDGVKRSCRRRLVGHNERRRKPPQPDTMAIAMARSLSSYQDHSVWSYANGPWPRLQNLEDRHGFADKLQIPASDRQLFHTALSVNSADRLLMPSQNLKKNVISMPSNISSEGTNSFMKGKMEHTLSLSSSPGAEILAGLAATQASHNFTGLSDSGCALSLLSSEAWAPRSQSSVSFNFPGHTQGPFEQLMIESTSSFSQPQPFFSVSTQEAQKHDIPTKNLLPMQVQLQGNIGQIKHLPASIAYSIGKEAQQSSCMPSALGTVGHYGSQSMLCMLHEQDFKNSQQAGTMLNLMHAPPSSQWQSVQPSESEELQSISPPYPEIQSRRPFDSSIFDTEQM